MKEEPWKRLRVAVVQALEANSSILNVHLSDDAPSSSSDISTWERRHGQLLPDDLREFYQFCGGMTCRWDVIGHGRTAEALGCMRVNSLSQLAPIDPATLLDERDQLQQGLPSAQTSGGLHPFDLDSSCKSGRVILLLGCLGAPRRAEVWFQDGSCGLTRLASSFTEYFRLLAISLGLPRWQYALTETGLDPAARQWFRLFAPHYLLLGGAKGKDAAGGAPASHPQIPQLQAPPPSPSPGVSVLAPPAPSRRAGGVQGAPLSHEDALAILEQQAISGVQGAAQPMVAAGNPRAAIALLNSGATAAGSVHAGGRPCCSRNSSVTSTSSSDGARVPPHATGTGEGRRRVGSAQRTGGGGRMTSKRGQHYAHDGADE